MRNDFESNYLAHHGILGQKWGHKNGPPYPLDVDDHSAKEKKAGWRESLHKKREQKRLAKEIKKATKESRTTGDAQKAMGQYVRSRLTSEQKEKLVSLKEQMEKDQDKAVKEFSKAYNKEYEKRFKGKKPSDEETDNLYYEMDDHLAGSKADVKAYESWDKYIQYSRGITESLIGKYGDDKLNYVSSAKYKDMINRVLDDVDKEKEYKNIYSNWNHAYNKWYWNLDKSKTKSLAENEKTTSNKEYEAYTKLKDKGYTDAEIRKMHKEVLDSDKSYHKYEEDYDRKHKPNVKFK